MASRTFGDNQPAHDRPDPPPPTLSPVERVEPTAGPMLMEITNAVVAACKTHTGKGPPRAEAHVHPDALYVTLRDWMTRAEQTLLARGSQDLIAQMRRQLHDQVADATRATVEHATSRTVIATRSHIEFDRDTAILLFILSPAAHQRPTAA
jgi:uncharacterized protein YbcI